MKSFKKLFENNTSNIASFEFYDDEIPISNDDFLTPEEFQEKICNEHIFISETKFGFLVEIICGPDVYIQALIKSTPVFMVENPEGLFDIYLKLLKEAKNMVVK